MSLLVHKETTISQQEHLFSFRLKEMTTMSMKGCERPTEEKSMVVDMTEGEKIAFLFIFDEMKEPKSAN